MEARKKGWIARDNRAGSSSRGYDWNWHKTRNEYLSGNPYCERCMLIERLKPAYLVHHKDRNPKNIDPENLESLCKECHKKEHTEEPKRSTMIPQWLEKSGIPVVMICGPPGSGKTTYAKSLMGDRDTLIDLDYILMEISGLPLYHDQSVEYLNEAVRERNKRLSRLKNRKHGNCYFIAGYPRYSDRRKMAEMLGAETIILETDSYLCKERISKDERRGQARKDSACKAVDQWWKNYVSGINEKTIRHGGH